MKSEFVVAPAGKAASLESAGRSRLLGTKEAVLSPEKAASLPRHRPAILAAAARRSLVQSPDFRKHLSSS